MMVRDSEVIIELARTMDVKATLKRHRIHAEDLKAILIRAASALQEGEQGPVDDLALVINTDGAARGNPGPGGAGFTIHRGGKLIEGQAQYLGEVTNNQAEYNALILALERALELGAVKVELRSDSELMVRQLNGVYRVKDAKLKPLFERARELIAGFDSFTAVHVRREHNSKADELANRAIDEFSG